jgi:TMEM175 potassium channel family protein
VTHGEAEAAKAERERDLDRLLTFVDAIVAIAITLLVLPLVELTSDISEADSVAELLRDHDDQLWSFALSFYVIARLWQGQHQAVSPLLVGSRRIVFLLMLWAFTIVVLPFPTALVAHAGEQAPTKALYVGTMAASLLVVAAIRAEVRARPELTDGSTLPGAVSALVSAGLLVLALGLMLVVPATSYVPILVLLADGPVLRLHRRLRNRTTT